MSYSRQPSSGAYSFGSAITCLDGVPFKIGESFRRPLVSDMSTDYTSGVNLDLLSEQYCFSNEVAVLKWIDDLKYQQGEDKQKLEDEQRKQSPESHPLQNYVSMTTIQNAAAKHAAPKSTLASTSSPPKSKQLNKKEINKSDNNPFTPASFGSSILQPVTVTRSLNGGDPRPMSDKKLDISLFEKVDDLFDNVELATLNDLEELKTVLQGSTPTSESTDGQSYDCLRDTTEVQCTPNPTPLTEVDPRPTPVPLTEVQCRPNPAPWTEVHSRPTPVPLTEVQCRPNPAPLIEVQCRPNPAPRLISNQLLNKNQTSDNVTVTCDNFKVNPDAVEKHTNSTVSEILTNCIVAEIPMNFNVAKSLSNSDADKLSLHYGAPRGQSNSPMNSHAPQLHTNSTAAEIQMTSKEVILHANFEAGDLLSNSTRLGSQSNSHTAEVQIDPYVAEAQTASPTDTTSINTISPSCSDLHDDTTITQSERNCNNNHHIPPPPLVHPRINIPPPPVPPRSIKVENLQSRDEDSLQGTNPEKEQFLESFSFENGPCSDTGITEPRIPENSVDIPKANPLIPPKPSAKLYLQQTVQSSLSDSPHCLPSDPSPCNSSSSASSSTVMSRSSPILPDSLHTSWDHYSPLPPVPKINDDPYTRLSEEAKHFIDHLGSLGFPRAQIARAVERFGQDEKVVIEYLCLIDKLKELGYTTAQSETALILYSNNYDQAKRYLELFEQFRELGFSSDRICTAIYNSNINRDKALDELTAAS